MEVKAVDSDSTSHEPRYRSGAVARMVRMPVATLRVWERRYTLAAPARTASGQRLYSAADVRRIALLKQLTELGHAIGRLATLDMAALREVATTHAGVVASSYADAATGSAPARPAVHGWRLAVVGESLATRLQRPALRAALGRPMVLRGPLVDAAAAAEIADDADALLLPCGTLQPGDVDPLLQAVKPWAGRPVGLLLGFAAEPVCERLAAAGLRLLHEPQGDVALGQWLASLTGGGMLGAAPMVLDDGEPPPPRRWTDATLAELAGLSTTIACECPRHLADLLRMLSGFEGYSAECASRGPADAALHRALQHAAGRSRRVLEDALERVVVHEGLLWPAGGAGR